MTGYFKIQSVKLASKIFQLSRWFLWLAYVSRSRMQDFPGTVIGWAEVARGQHQSYLSFLFMNINQPKWWAHILSLFVFSQNPGNGLVSSFTWRHIWVFTFSWENWIPVNKKAYVCFKAREKKKTKPKYWLGKVLWRPARDLWKDVSPKNLLRQENITFDMFPH